MNIPYEYFRIFYYSAKYQSFTKAAQYLISNQPNVTRAIHRMEQELGCRLFVRSRRGVTLTPEGEKLYAHVSVAETHLQAGISEIAGARNLSSGTVSIGVSEVALRGLLLPVLHQFKLSYPNIHICISNHTTHRALAAVRAGNVDFALVSTPTDVTPPLTEKKLIRFTEILVAGMDFHSLQDTSIHLQDVLEYPLICLERDTKTFEFYRRFFESYGLKLEPDITAASIDQLLPMVKNSLGLGFLARNFAQEALDRREVFAVKLAEPIPSRHICLVQEHNRLSNPAARELVHVICGYAARHGDLDK